MQISCRGLGASGLGRKLPTHGPLPETAAEFEPSEAHRIMVDETRPFRSSAPAQGQMSVMGMFRQQPF